LDAAENSAKSKRLNLWKDYDEAVEEEQRQKRRQANAAEKAASGANQKGQEFIDVIITEIIDANEFYVQIVGDEAAKLEDLMGQLSVEESVFDSSYQPKVKDIVKAQYTDDDQWYRASIISQEQDGQYRVFYVDYGNSETIPVDRIRALSGNFRVETLKPQANKAHLAFIKPPTLDEDYGPEAAEFLKELVESKTMMANIEYKNTENSLFLSLGDRESQVHVNAALVRAGLARVKKPRGEYLNKPKSAVDQLIAKLKEEETKARTSRTCMWEYGDPGSDEDEEKDRSFGKKKDDKKQKKTPSNNPSPAVAAKKDDKKASKDEE